MRSLLNLFRCRQLLRQRTGQNYESFACFFAGQGIPEPLLRETYRILAQRSPLRVSFPVHPLDSLREIYALDCYRGDALPALMNAIRRAGKLDFCNPMPAFLPCETVADLVHLLAARCAAVYPPTTQAFPAHASGPQSASLPEAR